MDEQQQLIEKLKLQLSIQAEEKKQLEAKKKQIEAEKKQIEELLIKKIELNPELKALLSGIPHLVFKKVVSSFSNHTSTHDAVQIVHNGKFTILDNIEKYYCDEDGLITASILLSRIEIKNRTIEYVNKPIIQALILDLFKDILSLCSLQHKTQLLQEITVPDGSGRRKKHKPDIWILKSNSKAPVLVIEVKSPNDTILDNDKVTGQIFNCMTSLRSFYGLQNVFGITTTFKEWKFHWFSDTNECAKSSAITTTTLTSEPSDLTKREIYSTETILYTDPKLIQTLVSIILKGYNSSASSLFISNKRVYVYFTENSWFWKHINGNELCAINTDINIDMKKTKGSFYILKYFHSGYYSHVSLAISSASSTLVVIKETNHVDIELNMWKKVNGSDSAFITLLNDTRVLILPLVFHASINIDKKVSFNFDIKQWSYTSNNRIEDIPSKLAKIQNDIKKYAEEKELTNVSIVAFIAIKKMIKNRHL
jgi:hypothetical protein